MDMPKRNLRVVKWLSQTPVIGVCELCSQQFKAPMSALSKTKDARASLQRQFDAHSCKQEPPSSLQSTKGIFTATLAMQNEQQDPWITLCQKAAVEQDPERLMRLIAEINRMLDENENRLKQ